MALEPGLPEPIERLRETYGDLSVLRAAVQQIPVVGPMCDTLLAGGASAIARRRIADFFEQLRAEFQRFVNDDYDEQFIQSQDFAHLVILACHAAARSRERERIRMYARILRNGSTSRWSARVDLVEETMNSLGQLSLREVEVLWAVRKWSEESGRRDELEPEQLAPLLPGFAESEIRAYCARVQRTGFIVGGASGKFSSTGGNEYEITPLLDVLMELTAEGPESTWRGAR